MVHVSATEEKRGERDLESNRERGKKRERGRFHSLEVEEESKVEQSTVVAG